jgi:hypothetical protein
MKTNFYLFFSFVFLMINAQLQSQQPCTLFCYNDRVINASSTCFTLVTPDMTISETMGDCGILTTTIMLDGDTVINPVPGYFNEQVLEAIVESSTSGNVCVTDIILRDINPPILSRRESFTSINCDIPIQLISPIIDECSDFTIEYTIEEFCDPVKGMVREYTWIAEDIAGNTGQMIVEYELQFDPSYVIFPGTFTIACDDPLATSCGGAPCPDVSGMPQISPNNCTELTIEYEDDIFNLYCEGYQKVLRTWNVYDPCELVSTHIQVIILEDVEGPVITTPSIPSVIQFDTWKNNAIPMATATDACGLVDLIVFEDFYDPTCDVLEITRVWTAYDDCGNYTTASSIFNVHYKFGCRIPQIPNTTCGDLVAIEADVMDGIPPFTYHWTNTGNWVIVSSPTQNPINVLSGNGQATFTVVVTDALGCETECTRKVKCKKPQNRVNINAIYSTEEILTVHWEIQEESNAKIKVWNLMGKRVAELEEMVFPGEHTTSLQLSDYTPGLYIISIDTENSRKVQKVVIN